MDDSGASEYAIEICSISKRFVPKKGLAGFFAYSPVKEPVTAVDNVNLIVPKGELFGLLGSNGAGKTTLIKMLCTLILPTSGTAIINGYDIVRQDHLVRQSIGLVGSEERSFYWRLTARQNLEFFCSLHGLSGESMRDRINDVLDLMDLQDYADRMFQTFSSGMKQKLCIARGLLTDPAILFLDEPTRSVDPMAAESIRSFIRETLVKKQGRTVILTTHRLEEAAQVCDRIAIMHKGRIKACGTLSELRSILKSPCVYRLKVQGFNDLIADKIRRIYGVDSVDFEVNAGNINSTDLIVFGSAVLSGVLDILVMNGVGILDCQSEEASLEDIFSKVINEQELINDVPASAGVS
ncbi:MAG: ATP-binding cassette domain-containing protein [Armatimonadota bacterium]